MIVVDASVAVKWFVTESGHGDAVALLDSRLSLIAPDFVLLETLNVLRRKLKRGEIVSEQVVGATSVLAGFFDDLIPAALLARRAAELSNALDHSIYDCAYLACAIEHGAILVTADERLANKAKQAGHSASVQRLVDVGLRTLLAGTADRDLAMRAVALHEAHQRTVDFVRLSVTGGDGATRFLSMADLRPAFDSLSRARLDRFAMGLQREQRVHLLALGWLGEGANGRDWTAIKARADAYLTQNPTDHLAYLLSLFGFLGEGQNTLDSLLGGTGSSG